MNIAVLNFNKMSCDFITNAPELDSQEEVEDWLRKSYCLDDIYYMCDAELQIINTK